jgi:hypothetical protein
MVTATICVDLTAEPDLTSSADRMALAALDAVPAGARVIVDIGSRRYVPPDTAEWLHRYDHRLVLDIHGSPDADVQAWVTPLATAGPGRWSHDIPRRRVPRSPPPMWGTGEH